MESYIIPAIALFAACVVFIAIGAIAASVQPSMLSIERLLDLLFDKKIITTPDGDPYMHRWYLFRTKRFSIMCHKFVRSDYDRALHDHPWNFIVIPVWRGYVEMYESYYNNDKTLLPVTRSKRVLPILGTRYRTGLYKHRVVLLKKDGKYLPAWSIFIRFTEWRQWGFWCPSGFKPWHPKIGDACSDTTTEQPRHLVN